MTFALITAALAGCALQDPPPPHPKLKVESALRVTERDGFHVFLVQGKTDLPDDAVLKARIFVVTVVNGFNGPRVDEEPLVWEDDESQAAFRTLDHERGLFKDDVYRFLMPPWPLSYRVRVFYDPRDQSDAVVKAVGADPHSWHADFRLGDDAAFAAMLAKRVVEVTDDLVELKKDFDALRAAFRAQEKAADAEAWTKWKEPWFDRLERRTDRNKLRYGFWAVWLERQARMRVGALCDLARRILVACNDHLKGEAQPARIRDAMKAWVQQWEEACDLIGIDLPLDADDAVPILAAYDLALAKLRDAVAKGDVDAVSSARSEGLTALLKLPPLLRIRKRGYVLASELTRRFTALLDAAEAKASPDAFRAALEEHQAALRAFRDYAGLPAPESK
jgi:hypothetical protein